MYIIDIYTLICKHQTFKSLKCKVFCLKAYILVKIPLEAKSTNTWKYNQKTMEKEDEFIAILKCIIWCHCDANSFTRNRSVYIAQFLFIELFKVINLFFKVVFIFQSFLVINVANFLLSKISNTKFIDMQRILNYFTFEIKSTNIFTK